MKQQRVDLWSAASYAVGPRALLDEHLSTEWADVPMNRHVADGVGRVRPGSSDDPSDLRELLATADGRLAGQDLDGLSGEVLLPDPVVVETALGADDGDQPATFAALNAWVADHQRQAPDRIVGVAQIPTTGLDDALAALDQAVADGLRAVALAELPAGPGTTPADAAEFWSRAAGRTVVCLGPQFSGGSLGARLRPAVAAGRPSPHVATLTRMALQGIWDDHPDLRILLAGVDAGWIPFVLQHADTNYLRTRASRPVDLRRDDLLPSEYVRRHCFATFGHDRAGALATHYFGESHLLWSAAVPTAASSWPGDEQQAARLTMGFPEELRRKVLGDNCRRLFGVEGTSPFSDDELEAFERPVLV